MALKNCFLSAFFVIMSFLSSFCSCRSARSLNVTLAGYSSAVATFYEGSGGACGFGNENDIAQPPFSSKIAAGNRALFKQGKGCGNCYAVLCSANVYRACSGSPVKITITDECPNACNNDPVHFDFSSTAFGYLAKPGQADALRKLGRINVHFQRVPCNYANQKIAFKVDPGSNRYYFSAAIEYENGDGDVASVEIQAAGSRRWFPMQQVFGATYKYNIPKRTNGPFSIRLTQAESRRRLVAQQAIPADWKPGSRYISSVNF
ncbi:expansin-B6-like [Coffea eugenioides]|uniref:Expansin-B6 n=1 Tax=Coffea arabica TaxID=13443 RepID=A0A6P6W2S4_COFAR|nr:expansin-B6-like [Coffea arabica]XP_027157701.1 expansin-B6-like [Coffea eugenioides]